MSSRFESAAMPLLLLVFTRTDDFFIFSRYVFFAAPEKRAFSLKSQVSGGTFVRLAVGKGAWEVT